MKIGDKVRFLNEPGGGRVSGFKDKNIVLVEDEDGFEVPMLLNEVVVIGEENYDTLHVVEMKQKSKTAEKQVETEPAERPITFKPMPEQRKGGELLSAYLAFVPIAPKELSQTRFESYFINDSNYYLRFTYLTAEGNSWQLRSTAEVEPNTKLFLDEFGRDQLNELEHVCMQVMAYKREKPFMLKPAIDVQFRVDTVKFYKLHAFQQNDFFEQPALIYTIIEKDQVSKPLFVDPRQLKQQLFQKKGQEISASRPLVRPSEKNNGTIVVDLHADEILETTKGMEAVDILNYQLDVFRKKLQEYASKKGTRIVFIHGKGEGVLRQAIINDLRYRFKQYTYQDASFQEYGYGATQVTIK